VDGIKYVHFSLRRVAQISEGAGRSEVIIMASPDNYGREIQFSQ